MIFNSLMKLQDQKPVPGESGPAKGLNLAQFLRGLWAVALAVKEGGTVHLLPSRDGGLRMEPAAPARDPRVRETASRLEIREELEARQAGFARDSRAEARAAAGKGTSAANGTTASTVTSATPDPKLLRLVSGSAAAREREEQVEAKMEQLLSDDPLDNPDPPSPTDKTPFVETEKEMHERQALV